MNERAHEQFAEYLPDYLIGALEPTLSDEVGQHLALCTECQRSVELLLESLALLGPQEVAPAHVKGQLFARLGSRSPNGVMTLPAPPQTQRVTPTPAPTPVSEPLPHPVAPPPAPISLASRRRWPWRLALVATLAILLGASGIWNVVQQRQLARQDTIARLIENPQAAHALTDTDLDTGATGTIYADPAGNAALVLVSRLPALPPDQQYQLWLFTESGDRVSGGLFTVGADGTGQALIAAPRTFTEYWAVAISAEPTGGSPAPTSALTLGGWIR